jgi:predicted HicB family RNase H-like nuclease
MRRKKITIRIDPYLAKQLAEEAARQGRSLSNIIEIKLKKTWESLN